MGQPYFYLRLHQSVEKPGLYCDSDSSAPSVTVQKFEVWTLEELLDQVSMCSLLAIGTAEISRADLQD